MLCFYIILSVLDLNFLKLFFKANIIIDEPRLPEGNDPYTLQYGECGSEGRYIHLTPDFLINDKLIKFYGPRGTVRISFSDCILNIMNDK